MAKRKGKSQQRQKQWEHPRQGQQDAGENADQRRRLTRRRVKLPGQTQDAAIFAEIAPARLRLAPEGLPRDGSGHDASGTAAAGVVARLYPAGALVQTADYGELMCGLAGTFRPAPGSSALAVGDEVELELMPETMGALSGGDRELDGDRVDALIRQRGPRATALSRPQPMRGKWRDRHGGELFEKVIAANMEQLVVVTSVARPAPRRRLLDRFLIIAQRGGLGLAAIMNKTDLGEPDAALMAEYVELGVTWTSCSATNGDGIEDVRRLLARRRSILAGASGVGKSSILNALLPGAALATREVRLRDDRGRHATTAAALLELPSGGQVIDTPGIRELGVTLGPRELPWYFPEFEPLSPRCRYRDCTHSHEPDCAVIAAVEAGELPHRRYQSYLRILESMEE